MLIKRIFSFIILSVLTFSILYFAPDIIFGLIISGIILVGLLEFFGLAQHRNIHVLKYFSSLAGLVIPVTVTFGGIVIFKEWALLYFVLILFCLFLIEFTKKDSDYVATNIGVSLFGILYISVTLSFVILIRQLNNGNNYIILLILIVKASDIGAYLVGKKFGRTHLIPRISPKKSIEGAIGGLIFSIIVAILSNFFVGFSLYHLFFIGILLGIFAQVGDLSESLIKRHFKVKDSGNFIPGIGGILDLLDSLIFAIPLFYFYIILIS